MRPRTLSTEPCDGRTDGRTGKWSMKPREKFAAFKLPIAYENFCEKKKGGAVNFGNQLTNYIGDRTHSSFLNDSLTD